MRYNLEDIKEAVRVVLDENQASDNIMEDCDTLSLDELILSKIGEAARDVLLTAPVHMLDPGNNFADAIAWEGECGKGAGWTILPDDFLRLIAFKMSDWERPVYAAILPADAEYALQKSRFAGLRGSRQRPVCAIVTRPQGLVLEFYSCAGGADVNVEMAIYQPMPRIEEEGINIPEKCYRSVVYKVAGLTAISVGRDSQGFFTVSNELLK